MRDGVVIKIIGNLDYLLLEKGRVELLSVATTLTAVVLAAKKLYTDELKCVHKGN